MMFICHPPTTSSQPTSTPVISTTHPESASWVRRLGGPGQTLPRFIAGTFGIPLREQALIVEAISDAISDAVPLVQEKMTEHSEFRNIGKRMLLAWREGVHGLREKRVYASGD